MMSLCAFNQIICENFFASRMAAILDFGVKMTSECKTNAKLGIVMLKYPQKVYLHMPLGALVQKLIFSR